MHMRINYNMFTSRYNVFMLMDRVQTVVANRSQHFMTTHLACMKRYRSTTMQLLFLLLGGQAVHLKNTRSPLQCAFVAQRRLRAKRRLIGADFDLERVVFV